MTQSLHVSVIVSSQSRTIENTHLRVEAPLEPALALAYRVEIDQWLAAMPDPKLAGTWQLPVREIPVDKASQIAVQLPQILHGRDPNLFSPYYEDPEHEAALIDKRPYDWTRAAA
jgi:hypothetical protein